LKDRFCRSTVEIRAHISEAFGLHYSHSGCIKLLARLGFSIASPRPFLALPRLWAVMHQYVTHNRNYSTQKQLANAILKFFREIIPNEWKSFRDKVSDNFSVISYDKFWILA